MLFPHSGRHGFDLLPADPTVPTPPKADVLAMLRREAELREAPETQKRLDALMVTARPMGYVSRPTCLRDAYVVIDALQQQLQTRLTKTERGEKKEAIAEEEDGGKLSDHVAITEAPPAETTLGIAELKSSELKAALAALGQDTKGARATLRTKLTSLAAEGEPQSKAVRAAVANQLRPDAKERGETVQLDRDDNVISELDDVISDDDVISELDDDDDAAVFDAIKLQVVREFGLSDAGVDLLYTAASRFPGDADIIEAAPYLKYNRSHRGKIAVGEPLPVDTLQLADLGGTLASLRTHLQAADSTGGGAQTVIKPTVLVAGSIT
eukprot:SAG11_NODE_303_length_11000_cov_7.979635_4_plen_325_part_00